MCTEPPLVFFVSHVWALHGKDPISLMFWIFRSSAGLQSIRTIRILFPLILFIIMFCWCVFFSSSLLFSYIETHVKILSVDDIDEGRSRTYEKNCISFIAPKINHHLVNFICETTNTDEKMNLKKLSDRRVLGLSPRNFRNNTAHRRFLCVHETEQLSHR